MNKTLGQAGEERAYSFLEDHGFTIIEKNYSFSTAGEIDLIARKDNLLIFVEVKTRSTEKFGGARYSINPRKRRTIRRVANQFLQTHPDFYTKEITCRFDMIAIENNVLEWIEDIIR